MTKTRTKKGFTDPFKPVKEIQFSFNNFALYKLHQDNFIQIAIATAKRVIKSGSNDEFRQLYLYVSSFNEWNNYAFHYMVGAAALLHDYYTSIPDYPIPKRFTDAVMNAVEYRYTEWLSNDLITVIPYSLDDKFRLERILEEHKEIIMRAHSWYFRQNHSYLEYLPVPKLPLSVKRTIPSVTVSWMKTKLVSPVCSAPLPAVDSKYPLQLP